MTRFVWVDAGPVRAHLRHLVASGLTIEVIKARAGLGHTNIRHLLTGVRGRDTATTRRDIALALLGVEPDHLGPEHHGWVDVAGTTRRLRALTARGWPILTLATLTGISKNTLRAALYGRSPLVRARTRNRVAAVEEHLAGVVPPAGCGPTRARRIAARHGWQPVTVWSGGGIDDPAARPVTDRALLADSIADLLDIDPGLTRTQICARLVRSRQAITDALRSAGRHDLRDQINRNTARHEYRETT